MEVFVGNQPCENGVSVQPLMLKAETISRETLTQLIAQEDFIAYVTVEA